MTDTAWPPAVGEAIGPERAAATLARFEPDLRRTARETVAAIRAAEPGVRVDGRMYRADELAGVVRGEGMPGVSAAYVSYLGRSGSVSVVSILIGWDGAVWAAGAPSR